MYETAALQKARELARQQPGPNFAVTIGPREYVFIWHPTRGPVLRTINIAPDRQGV